MDKERDMLKGILNDYYPSDCDMKYTEYDNRGLERQILEQFTLKQKKLRVSIWTNGLGEWFFRHMGLKGFKTEKEVMDFCNDHGLEIANESTLTHKTR